MRQFTSQTVFHSFLYGGASALLVLNLLFLIRAIFLGDIIPLMPILAGVLLTSGLLLVLYAEYQARVQDKKEHRRLSRVAHQLESPLRALQDDFAYLVKQADTLPAEGRMKLKRMETKTKVLLDNIRDVFLLLRGQQGRVTQEARAYDACSLVREAALQAKPLAAARNVEILFKPHCQDAPIYVDRSLFLIALGHLIENGMTYTITPGILNIAVIKGRSTVRILVQDRGIGIKEEDLSAIDLPFARGHQAQQFDPDGIGVGLTLAQLIVKEVGGSLTWRRRQGRAGTEFEIKLPLSGT
jgi:signal transduction histidine kinase